MGGTATRDGVEVFLEVGAKRAFAGAIDWPGWCRSGRDEQAALQALLDCGLRYERALRSARAGFVPPGRISDLVISERVKGDATTDFGAPGGVLKSDGRPIAEIEVRRMKAILNAIWSALDGAIGSATGHELRKGPRGGGRDLEGIIGHILEADGAYLAKVGWQVPRQPGDRSEALRASRAAVLAALEAAAAGQIALRGPRGGRRWSGRTFVRRVGWHALDHAWEIEDRIA